MKKFIAILLAMVLVFTMLATLGSCGKNDDDVENSGNQATNAPDETSTEQTTATTTGNDSIIDQNGQILSYYNNDITFELPENYMRLETSVAAYFDITSGNELTVLYTDATTLYDGMTTELFETMFKQAYEADGSVFSEPAVKIEEIDGVEVTHVFYILEKDGVKSYNTQYVMTIEDTTYFINILETAPEGDLSKRVLDTLTVLNKSEEN